MKNAVSLLPAEYRSELARHKKLAQAQKKMALGAAVLAVIAVGTMAVRLWGDVSIGQLQDRQQQVETETTALAQYQKLAQQKASLFGKVYAVQMSDNAWIAAVDSLCSDLPDGTWLNGFSTTADEEGYRCKLNCGAVTNESAAQLVTAWKKNAAVSGVTVGTASATSAGIQFDVTVALKAPAER